MNCVFSIEVFITLTLFFTVIYYAPPAKKLSCFRVYSIKYKVIYKPRSTFIFYTRRYSYVRSLMNCYMLPCRLDYIFTLFKIRGTPFPLSIAYSVLPFGIVVELLVKIYIFSKMLPSFFPTNRIRIIFTKSKLSIYFRTSTLFALKHFYSF